MRALSNAGPVLLAVLVEGLRPKGDPGDHAGGWGQSPLLPAGSG